MANAVKSIRESIGWPGVNSIQMPVSNTKVSNAVPLCLPNNYTWDSVTKKISVDTTKPRKSLIVCSEGLELLQRLQDQLLVVLCIAGPARSGKSFFASQLLKDVNFDVGHGAGSHTSGIWIGVGAKPVSLRSGKARVVILDAEGLGGVNTDSSNTDAKWEHKIFSLCVLLSSYVIYNSKGPPNNDELDKLGFIAEFSRSIFREREKDVDKLNTASEGLGQFGPDFLWLFRDILCTPDLNGQACEWTDFVKTALLDPKPNEPERNRIRKSISSTFRTIQAADIPPPTFDSKAVKNLLSEESKHKINHKFFPRIEEVAQNMLSTVQVKNIKGSKLTGSQLIDMLLHVVDTVNSECDKLDVTSMWDSIVNAEMQRHIQRSFDLYKKKMEQVELPEKEETFLKRHESTKDHSKTHFVTVTKRFDKDICSSQLKVLCDKIKTEFNDTLLIKNDQVSLTFNKELIIALENEHFNKLPEKSSCMKLKTADKNINDCFNERAKGSKAVKRKVKSQAQLQRDQKIYIMRTESLTNAEQRSCGLFEMSLKEALEGESLIQSKLNALKETLIKDCFNNFRKVTCNDVNCTPCMKSEHSLSQKVESIFKSCSSECYDKSDKACQFLIKKIIQIKLLPFVMNIDSHNYSDFLKLKEEMLAQYDREAKGPAKKDLMGTCTKTIDMQNEGIQLLIMQSALKSVSCEYTNILNETAKIDPCEAEKLDKMLALKRRDMISAFNVKCVGIDKSKLIPYQLNLEDVIKNFTVWIANENKSRSINLCEDLVSRLSREFHDGIFQTYIPEILRETECSQCSHHLLKAEKLKDKILTDYEQKACGPEKERFQQSLNEYLEIHLIIVKEAVNEMILKIVLQHHFYQLDIIKQNYPISETELESAFSETNKNTEKEFIDAQKQISLPFVSCSKDILPIILNFDTRQLVEENYKMSIEDLDTICKQISLESRMKCEELVKGGKADTVKFAELRDSCTNKFDESGIGVLKDHYRDILQGNIDMELRFAHTTIADKTVKRIFVDCRTSIENLVQGNPREQDDLEKDIKRVKEDAREEIKNLQKVGEGEGADTEIEEMLKIELKDTISYVEGKNLRISSEKCSAQLREVLKTLTNLCKVFLDNEESTVEALCNIKKTCLLEYENGAIGPAKRNGAIGPAKKNGAIGPAKKTVRDALEKEIDKEIQRTYVLFAKTNYRETLRVQTEAFKYDQVNSSGGVNLDRLTVNLEKESQDILDRYPGSEDEILNDLRKDLHRKREFYLKALYQKITLTSEVENYRSSIEALIKHGPCEEKHLKEQIDKKREETWERIEETFKEVEQTNCALTVGMLEKAMEDTTHNIKTQNHILSTTKCNSSLVQVLEELRGDCQNFLASDTSEIVNLRHLKDKFLRQYDEVAIGPAKADERKKLEKEIVEEVERTSVLFAKAEHGEILRKEIEQFSLGDLLNNPEPESIELIVQLLKNKVRDILQTYPTLGETTRNNLTKELKESINPSLLKELITAYENKINNLRKSGILEEDELEKEIEPAKNGLLEIISPRILDINGDLLKESQTYIDNVKTSFKKENFDRSRRHCQETIESLFEYNWDYLTKKYFKKLYDEKCKGPAKQMVWNENAGRVDEYYNSYPVMFRKVWSPFRFISHAF